MYRLIKSFSYLLHTKLYWRKCILAGLILAVAIFSYKLYHFHRSDTFETNIVPTTIPETCLQPFKISNHQVYISCEYAQTLQRKEHVSRHFQHVIATFHGCSHDGTWWVQAPEERIVVSSLHQANSLVIAFSSLNAQSKHPTHQCWDVTTPFDSIMSLSSEKDICLERTQKAFKETLASVNPDIKQVSTILHRLIELDPELVQLPWHFMGVSSGGVFTSLLSTFVDFPFSVSSQILYISTIHQDIARYLIQCAASTPLDDVTQVHLYPTLFWYMPQDQMLSLAIHEHSKQLASRQIDTKFIRYPETILSVTVLNEKLPCLEEKAAKCIIHMLQSRNILDRYGKWETDSRTRAVTDIVEVCLQYMQCNHTHFALTTDYKRIAKDAVLEILHASRGIHEFSAYGHMDVLAWIQSFD